MNQILGLLTFLLTISTVALYCLATRRPQYPLLANLSPLLLSPLSLVLLLNISLLTIILAFQDITTLSLCITQVVPFAAALVIGIIIALTINVATLLQVLEWWLQRTGNSAKGGTDEEAVEKEEKPIIISAPILMDNLN